MATEHVVETVAESLEEAAVVTRQINTKAIGLVAGGIGIGLVVGFVIGWRFNRAKIYAEAFRQSEEEVEQIRQMYRDATMVQTDSKPPLNAVVEELGYKQPEEVPERPTRPPVPAVEPVVEIKIPIEGLKSVDADWDFEEELANRTPERPYIIHEHEFSENETTYRQETLSLYATDGVLADEHEGKIEDIDDIVGTDNLNKFGHGSGDHNTVFIRNEAKNMEYEVVRIFASYAEEVLGLHDEQTQ